MSDTPMNADACKKLLDNGWTVVLFRNLMGSYTAAAMKDRHVRLLEKMTNSLPENCITDDFEPSQALYRLTEKCLTGNIV